MNDNLSCPAVESTKTSMIGRGKSSFVEISKVDAHTNAAVFLCHRDYIGNPV